MTGLAVQEGQAGEISNADGAHPRVSVVMPCLNEELGIAASIRAVKQVFQQERIDGEIVVSDNGSTDDSRRIALSECCRVVDQPERGYGAAYMKGLSEARGEFIIMADADHTYDFNAIPDFLRLLQEGNDFVLGSRFKGKIHPGAMPWARRYIGNPVLSTMTRLLFRTRLSDIHCGMRGLRRSALADLGLKMPGMEFATEMVVSVLRNGLRVAETPVDYFPRKGASKLNPLHDAWRHVIFMIRNGPSWLWCVPAFAGLAAVVILILVWI